MYELIEFSNYLELVSINAKLRASELHSQEIIRRLTASPLRKIVWGYKHIRSRIARYFVLFTKYSHMRAFYTTSPKSRQVENKASSLFTRKLPGCIQISYQYKEGFAAHREEVIQTSNDCVIFIHAYYTDVAAEIFELVSNIKDIDVVITTPKRSIVRLAKLWFKYAENVRVLLVDNRGRDILPFLLSINVLDLSKYSSFAKVHTKRSWHLPSGHAWYHEITYSLLGSPQFFSFLRSVTFKGYPFLVGRNTFPIQDHLIQNKTFLRCLIPRFQPLLNAKFIPGTVFFGNSEFLLSLKSKYLFKKHFEKEAGQLDGTLAHALERYFGYICSSEGGLILTYHQLLGDRQIINYASKV